MHLPPRRSGLSCLFALLLLGTLPAHAAPTSAAPTSVAPTSSTATPAAQAKPISPAAAADVNTLIRILQNDQARAALIARLQGVAPAIAAAPPPPSFAGRVADDTRAAAMRALTVLDGARRLIAGIVLVLRGVGTIDLWQVWLAMRAVVLVLAVTFAVHAVLRWGSGRVGRACDDRAADARWGRRLALLLAANAVDALGVALAWGVGYVFALGVGGSGWGSIGLGGADFGALARVSFSQSLFLNAFLFVELLKVALRLMLVPVRTHLRVVPLDDTAAAYWYFWSSRLVGLLGYSFMFVAPLVFYGGAWAAAQAIRILAMFTATAIVVAVVLQNRDRVRVVLSRRLNGGRSDAIARVAAYLGTVWHMIAITYALVVFVVWLANPDVALPFLLQATVQSLVAAALGVVVEAFIARYISSGVRLPQDVRDRLPLLETRLNAFVPVVLRVVRLVVLACVLLIVAQIWRVLDFVGWLVSNSGRQVTGSLVLAVMVLLIGGLVHVAVASWVEYRLNPNFGTVPTARERTLLALFRNAFTIALVVVVAMLALSQIGVNIAPLLAGAGVLGLAIGFGAQKLVQDIITGVFIQFENAMNEGEVVTAAGITGTVERLTIRSVSIRDMNGTLHIVPFSTVDKVSNYMRHFSYYVAEIGVAYRESIAEVKEAMQEAFDKLQQTEHGVSLMEPLEMNGLTTFGDSAINVRARIKTLPGRHWAVGRAYNEIIKEVFDARGIDMPFPHVTLYMGEDKQGNAPPLRIRPDRRPVVPTPVVPAPTVPASEATPEADPEPEATAPEAATPAAAPPATPVVEPVAAPVVTGGR